LDRCLEREAGIYGRKYLPVYANSWQAEDDQAQRLVNGEELY